MAAGGYAFALAIITSRYCDPTPLSGAINIWERRLPGHEFIMIPEWFFSNHIGEASCQNRRMILQSCGLRM